MLAFFKFYFHSDLMNRGSWVTNDFPSFISLTMSRSESIRSRCWCRGNKIYVDIALPEHFVSSMKENHLKQFSVGWALFFLPFLFCLFTWFLSRFLRKEGFQTMSMDIIQQLYETPLLDIDGQVANYDNACFPTLLCKLNIVFISKQSCFPRTES